MEPNREATSTSTSIIGKRLALSDRARLVLVAAVVAAGLWATVWSWRTVRGRALDIEHQRFAKESDAVAEVLGDRFAAYIAAMRGAKALFASSITVEREEWRAYVETLGVFGNHPGIQGLGFSVRVPAELKEAHVARVRAEGHPDYDIRPVDPRPEYHSILYLEPFTDRNLRAFGYDMFTEPVRRLAMERARDLGEAAMSGKVRLMQETAADPQHGFLIYLPVYRREWPTGTVEERQKALEGFVYSAFRVDDFMRGALGTRPLLVTLEMFDGATIDPAALMHDGRPADLRVGYTPRFSETRTLSQAGQEWTLRIGTTPAFDRQSGTDLSLLVLAGGLALTALLGGFALHIVRHASEVERLVSRRTAELKHANALLRQENAERRLAEAQREATVKSMEAKNAELELFNQLAVGRELRMVELKREINELRRQLGEEERFDLGFAPGDAAKEDRP